MLGLSDYQRVSFFQCRFIVASCCLQSKGGSSFLRSTKNSLLRFLLNLILLSVWRRDFLLDMVTSITQPNLQQPTLSPSCTVEQMRTNIVRQEKEVDHNTHENGGTNSARLVRSCWSYLSRPWVPLIQSPKTLAVCPTPTPCLTLRYDGQVKWCPAVLVSHPVTESAETVEEAQAL